MSLISRLIAQRARRTPRTETAAKSIADIDTRRAAEQHKTLEKITQQIAQATPGAESTQVSESLQDLVQHASSQVQVLRSILNEADGLEASIEAQINTLAQAVSRTEDARHAIDQRLTQSTLAAQALERLETISARMDELETSGIASFMTRLNAEHQRISELLETHRVEYDGQLTLVAEAAQRAIREVDRVSERIDAETRERVRAIELKFKGQVDSAGNGSRTMLDEIRGSVDELMGTMTERMKAEWKQIEQQAGGSCDQLHSLVFRAEQLMGFHERSEAESAGSLDELTSAAEQTMTETRQAIKQLQPLIGQSEEARNDLTRSLEQAASALVEHSQHHERINCTIHESARKADKVEETLIPGAKIAEHLISEAQTERIHLAHARDDITSVSAVARLTGNQARESATILQQTVDNAQHCQQRIEKSLRVLSEQADGLSSVVSGVGQLLERATTVGRELARLITRAERQVINGSMPRADEDETRKAA